MYLFYYLYEYENLIIVDKKYIHDQFTQFLTVETYPVLLFLVVKLSYCNSVRLPDRLRLYPSLSLFNTL